MEKDAEAVLQLFRQGFSQPNEEKSLECILQAIKSVSMSLPFTTHDHITCHPEVIKMLVISSPVNKESILFLLEALIGKFKNKQYVIFSVWKIFEGVAQLEPKTVSTILTRRIIDFDPDPRKKNNKVNKVEEQYLIGNLCEIKRTVLKLIPQLFEIIWERSPMELKEKLLIFKLFRMECKDPELLLDISKIAEDMKHKYSSERESRRPMRIDTRSEKRKHTTRKILPPPSKFSVDKMLMEEYICNKSEDLLTVLKIEANMEALISFVLHPTIHPLEEKIWGKILGNEKQLQTVRKDRVLEIFEDYRFFRKIVATCPELFNIFFNYLDTHNVNDLNLQGVQSLIHVFLREQPSIVSMLLMKSSVLENFYPFCEDSIVYEFILKVACMTNFRSSTGSQLKSLYYTYFRDVDFFPVMINNLCRVKHDKLTALKPKDILDLESMFKKYYCEKRKNPRAMIHGHVPRNSSLYSYRENKTRFFEGDRVMFFPPLPSTKKIIDIQPIRAPFTVKQFKGYYSTAPVLNFFSVQQQKINIDNEQWHHMNCKLYYDILRSATLLTGTDIVTPEEILTTIIPDRNCLEELFILLKKYTYLYKINNKSNSAIITVRILNLILQSKTHNGSKLINKLCVQHIHSLYPIISMLFQTEKKSTKLQSLTIVKTLGRNILEIVQLFLNFLHRVEPQDRQNVLDEIQQDLWYILMLWMFDCMINNIYQCLSHDIFSELFTYGRESLLIKILFKYNMISCLHNAHQDIVKNRVLLVGWHIHSFYNHIRRMYFLIRLTYQKRTELNVLKANINKLLTWNLLSGKMSSRRQQPGSLDDLSPSAYSNSSLISQ